jgi:1,4-alpha-glucan branching enzyme
VNGKPRQPARNIPVAELINAGDLTRLLEGRHHHPHRVLGVHGTTRFGPRGAIVRALHPEATAAACIPDQGAPIQLQDLGGGLFAAFLPRASRKLRYRLRFNFANGDILERDDPYRFPPTIGDVDLHLFNEGTHRRLWTCLGAHHRQMDGVEGVSFAVWAPNAERVSVVGDFCRWDGRIFPMRALGTSGVFEIFIPDVHPGALYKYEIRTRDGSVRVKTDPLAFEMELPPHSASRVAVSSYKWGDEDWLATRANRDPTAEPMATYEVHLGSWAREHAEANRLLTYRELAARLADHVTRLGFTHVELLPIAEHPFTGSWGYQVAGYYAPTARHGTPDDFRFFVDHLHQSGIGVILDWVPGHFPKDDYALRRFDGTALYEHDDPRRAEHPDWGTLIFNYGRREVRNFLMANALYWLSEFHIDGLRVDAVASMLYLDYSRKEGEWTPNPQGGRENLEAIDFLQTVNDVVAVEQPGCFTVAEESTAWTGVTAPVRQGGLGFTFKWNMGWMHDTLAYFGRDPIHRGHHHDQLTFAQIYEHTERFIMPLSHDEVVYGKRSLLQKMPGDEWQKYANLRTLLTYQYTRPGKQLLFMGTELAPEREWNHDAALEWHLAEDPPRMKLARFLEGLNRLYRDTPCLWRSDPDPHGFRWIDCTDREHSVVSYERRFADEHVLVVLNLTPVPRPDYRIGAPQAGGYRERFSSDSPQYGGSDFDTLAEIETDQIPYHGYPQSLLLHLPPLGALILSPTPNTP